MKKEDLPAMPFYFGDWRKAPEVRAMELDTRMIWFEMLGFMWESTERGFLTICNKPVSNSVITRMLGIDIITLEKALNEMESLSVFSRREDGAIYCRKMVRDQEIRELRSKAGSIGMDKRYNKIIEPVITKPITNPESETVIVNKELIKIEFEKFWNEYDKKVGEKIKVFNKWKVLPDSDKLKILEHIPKYKLSQPDKKYRKNPETYLNNKSWNDEIIENNGTTGTLQKTGIRQDLSDKDYSVIV